MNNNKHTETREAMTDDRAVNTNMSRNVVLDSSKLLCGRNEVKIRHMGEYYSLRLTKNQKLILNK